MAFKWLHNHNPFLLPLILVIIFLIGHRYIATRPHRFRPWALKINQRMIRFIFFFGILLFLLTLAFESYFYQHQCTVSQKYIDANIHLARTVMSTFDEHAIPYWLDYATLLCALRGQTINTWDHDVDLSTLHPSIYGKTVNDLIAHFQAKGLKTTWDPPRHLIQVWTATGNGPHIDLWLWTKESHENVPYLHTADLTVEYNPRLERDIMPLHNMTWLGRSASVPADAHAVSKKEFDVYGGSYMTSQVFRGDCFHNFFNLRFMY